MADVIQDFLGDCELRDMAPSTISNYRSNLRIFASFLTRKNLEFGNVDYRVLRDFLDYLKHDRNNSMKRISNYFSAISTFYDYLISEGIVTGNPTPPIRKRYLRFYKKHSPRGQRRAVSVEEMAMLINSILDSKYKAVATLFAKTGIRRSELIRIDLADISWTDLSITLKPCAKRSNRKVFFDDECARVLKRWLARRQQFGIGLDHPALFISKKGGRLQRSQITRMITRFAQNIGLHDPNSERFEDRFSPHYFRLWFTTWLSRDGMPREYIKELRGDSRGDAIDIYNHIDYEDLRKKYLACIPQLGVI